MACVARRFREEGRTLATHYWLSEEQFTRPQPLLPSKGRGVPRVDDRRVISGIVHVLQSGGRGRDAPAVYGPDKTLYNRFVRWARKGGWEQVFTELAAAGGPPMVLMLDSPPVKAHRAAGGGKGGRLSRRLGARGAAARRNSMPPLRGPGAPGGCSSAPAIVGTSWSERT